VAALGTSVPAVEILAAASGRALLEPDRRGRLPLHVAAFRKGSSTEVVRCLAQKCPRALAVRVRNEYGMPLLHWAVRIRWVEMLQILVDAAAAEGGGEALPERDGEGQVPLHVAVDVYDPAAKVRCLVRAGPLVLRERNHQGDLPLHKAIKSNADLSNEAVRVMVDAWDQTLQERDKDGLLPLHLAVRWKPVELIRWEHAGKGRPWTAPIASCCHVRGAGSG
jgi:ankyrin repeat protein